MLHIPGTMDLGRDTSDHGVDCSALRSEVSFGHFGTSAKMSGHLNAKVSWCRSIPGSKCLVTDRPNSFCCCFLKYEVPGRLTDTSDPRQFRPETFRHQCQSVLGQYGTGAKVFGHSGTKTFQHWDISIVLDRYSISVSTHSLRCKIGEYDISVCVSADADTPAAITINSNRTRRLKHMARVDRMPLQMRPAFLFTFRRTDCGCDARNSGKVE